MESKTGCRWLESARMQLKTRTLVHLIILAKKRNGKRDPSLS